MTEEFVYVIGAPGSNTVKIGRTINLAKRLAAIQCGSPLPLQVLWSHQGGHELETRLHRHFKHLRTHGEWFAFRCEPVPLIRWAVEDQPWLRQKISLTKVIPRKTVAPGPARLLRVERAKPPRERVAPVYRQIAQHVVQEVRNGSVQPGQKLAPRHVYASRFGVGIETVKRAFDHLAMAGILERRYASGYSVPVLRADQIADLIRTFESGELIALSA